jgi:HEAT repeat protein
MEDAMAISIEQLGRMLNADEPPYYRLARHGATLLPLLARLAQSRNTYIAANAASLAGMIGTDQALGILQRAVRNPSPQVRTAVAGALWHIRSPQASGIIASLLNDSDKGVRKFAIKSAMAKPNAALSSKIADLSKRDPQPHLRSLASQALSRSRLA